MFHGIQNGLFWLLEKPEHTVSGTLSVDNRGKLELTTQGLLDVHDSGDTRRTICGATPSGHVTLVGAQAFNKSQSINRYLPVESQETWHCDYAFQSHSYEGNHLDEGIVSIEVEIESLPDWAYEGRNLRLNGRDGNVSWPSNLSWPMEQPGSAGGWSLGEVTIRHAVYSSGSGRPERYRAVNVTSTTSFVVNFNRPQPLTSVQSTVSSLQALVSVAIGQAVGVERVTLTVNAGTSDERLSLHYEPVLRPLNPIAKESELFSMSELGGLEGVGKWLDLLWNQTHVKNGLLADKYQRPMFITDKTNHLLLAHEAYQRHITNRVGRKMDVPKILGPALDVVDVNFLDWIESREGWIRKVNNVRIEQVAHLESYGNVSVDAQSLSTLNRQLYSLLVARILADCGLPVELLEEVVMRSRSDSVVRLP